MATTKPAPDPTLAYHPTRCQVCQELLQKTVHANGNVTYQCQRPFPPKGVPAHSCSITVRRPKA